MSKNLKFESSIEFTGDVVNQNFHKARLRVLHSGLNDNGSIVSDNAMNEAQDSIKNTPILAFIKRDENGDAVEFGGHDSELQLKEKDGELYFKEFFLEQPIGVIPESNNPSIEEIDGKNYFTCDCFIWKSYSNEAYDMLVENDVVNVSCEMSCKSIEFDENDVMTINKFVFLGVTVIGVPPGMQGAQIDMSADFSLNKNKEMFTNNVKELNTYLKMQLNTDGKEDINLEDDIKKVENTEIENKEVFEKEAEVKTEEVKKEVEVEKENKVEFGLSIDNLRASINSQLQNITTQYTDRWNDTYEVRAFYLNTILPEEKIVVLEDYNDWNKNYGVNYSMDGDNVVLDLESKTEYIQEWRVKSSTDTPMVFERENVIEELLVEKYNKKVEDLENAEKELGLLQEFKANYEKNIEVAELNSNVEEVISKFEFEEEEISELKEKALNKDIDLQTFELNLKGLAYDKTLANKEVKFNKEDKPTKIEVKAIEKDEIDNSKEKFEEIKAKFLAK